ncbi:MAG: sel1 repeat family protein [Candidatus Methanomethylophilaceae archaeon]|nr:sel1 repeat family protein [Candidatus Methanomethylophilaceae archaeon]
MTVTAVFERFDVRPEDAGRFRRVAEAHDSPAMYLAFARFLLELGGEENDREAASVLERAAGMGCADAAAMLGDCHFFGRGVPEDRAKAIEIYVGAAETGSLPGCYSAGNELLYGRNVAPDYARAYGFLKKAADAGDERAVNSLGIMHLLGLHVAEDRREAKRLFRRAARAGDGSARLNLRILKAMGRRADLSGATVLKPGEAEQICSEPCPEADAGDMEGKRRASPPPLPGASPAHPLVEDPLRRGRLWPWRRCRHMALFRA